MKMMLALLRNAHNFFEHYNTPWIIVCGVSIYKGQIFNAVKRKLRKCDEVIIKNSYSGCREISILRAMK